MFHNAPLTYIPYLSVQDVYVHLEPYKAKLSYHFSVAELSMLDAMHNTRAKDVLKRGYDQLIYDDVLIYVVLQLQNKVKLWLPLSPTQLQYPVFSQTSMFGFTGYEVATIVQLIASQLIEEDEVVLCNKKEKLEKIAVFLRSYQDMRQQSVAEEALHCQAIDKILIPVIEE